VNASAARPWLGLYESLLARYGPQGWWPLAGRAGRPGYDERGYHPGRYGMPAEPRGRFEVAVGAVLTQNTSWINVEAALAALRASGLLAPAALCACPLRRLAALVRSSGYFNQKARKLQVLARFWSGLSGRKAPERGELLALWGVGPETADSILLYAFHRPVFVVDAYTRRLLARLGWAEGRESYQELQARFHAGLPARAPLYQELHALIVRHAKEHCRLRPRCRDCPLAVSLCPWPAGTAALDTAS
jgi:endonuclease-3 related protein